MASLIKRFRESPPLSKAERRVVVDDDGDAGDAGGASTSSLPGFWWRSEAKHHIEKEQERDFVGDSDGGGGGDDAGPLSEALGKNAIQDHHLHTMLEDFAAQGEEEEEVEEEDILQAWRKRNRFMLQKRGMKEMMVGGR